jgi:hypothetical protein
MKNKFVADSYRRFMRARKAVSSESIEKKYAAELAKADPARKFKIRERMVQEYLHSKNLDHQPSPGTLW